MLAAGGIAGGIAFGLATLPVIGWLGSPASARSEAGGFACPSPRVVDGDTIRCGPVRVRLTGIDAPELPGHCNPGRACTPGDPYAATENLQRLIGGRSLVCQQTDTDRYGRVVARCSAGGRDLSCEQVRGGYAVRRYAPLAC